jgi:hypothetical protein
MLITYLAASLISLSAAIAAPQHSYDFVGHLPPESMGHGH